MWWLCLGVALAEPVSEEVVVYDEQAMWDGTRYLLRSEQDVSTGVRLGVPGEPPVRAPAWQLEMVVACELSGRRRALCAIEDAALRASTVDQWQRPGDRERVDALLGEVRARLLTHTLDIRFDGTGGLRRVDLPETGSEDRVADLVDLATRVLGGVSLPPGAMSDGAVWDRPFDALLKLPSTLDGIQTDQVVHYGNHFEGHYLVQTVGEARAQVELLPVLDRDHGPVEEAADLASFAQIGQAPPPEGIRLSALAAFDPGTGVLRERMFTVVGGAPRPFWHRGRVRRLAPDEHVRLGGTHQVAHPGVPRLLVEPWVPLFPIVEPAW